MRATVRRLRRAAERPGRAPRLHGDQGAVVVESILVLPVLIAFISGIIDFGMAYRDRQSIQGALRNASRVAASSNNYGQFGGADRYTLTALQGGLADISRFQINRVVIFRNNPTNWTTGPGNTVPSVCLTTATNNTTGAGNTTSACNIYSGTQLTNASGTFTTSVTGTTCSSSVGWDRFWCPPTRNQNLTSNSGNGPDYLGVYIQGTYTTYTGFFSKTIPLQDTVVVRIEPDVTP